MVVWIALGSAVLYLVAYHTYGRVLARKIFRLDPTFLVPSRELRDDQDYLPTKKQIVFGHHFASIAGTGPIVGPAIAIIWGWLPALLWVLFGAILMGGVHDMGAMVVSLRNKGRSIGDVTGDIIRPWVRILFLVLVYLCVLIVMAVFVLVIAALFSLYPESVAPVWLQVPIAMTLGWIVYRKDANPLLWSIPAVLVMYATIVLGAYLPIQLPEIAGIPPSISWVLILFIYAYIASTLPVWRLLQPRDYINSHQLLVAMALLAMGVFLVRPEMVAPVTNLHPEGSPSLIPFLFITVACGAISGFHSLVGSGTSSKQVSNERDAQFIGYGAMLLEGMLAVLVIIAAGAGIGLHYEVQGADGAIRVLTGKAAFAHHFASWSAAEGLGAKVGAFVSGAANILAGIGIPRNIGIALMGMFVASFAGTSLDSATRIQRYIITELASNYHVRPLKGRHGATLFAVITAALLAFTPVRDQVSGELVFGRGGLLLWPLFGTSNQLLAALGLTVVSVYLVQRRANWLVTAVPMVVMLGLTSWAMVVNLGIYLESGKWHLLLIGGLLFIIEIFIVAAAAGAIHRSKTEQKRSAQQSAAGK